MTSGVKASIFLFIELLLILPITAKISTPRRLPGFCNASIDPFTCPHFTAWFVETVQTVEASTIAIEPNIKNSENAISFTDIDPIGSKDPSNVVLSTDTQAVEPISSSLLHEPLQSSVFFLQTTSTTTTTTTAATATGSLHLSDRDIHFVGFEEWKQIYMAKKGKGTDEHSRRRFNPNNRLQVVDGFDSNFGDDFGSVFERSGQRDLHDNYQGEIDLEKLKQSFSPSLSVKDQISTSLIASKELSLTATAPHLSSPSPVEPISSLKTLKERFNYASFDCAAHVITANTEAKGLNLILIESKEQYLLNKCSTKKFVIVELCVEIWIDHIVLANYEFFSSTFKDFHVSKSDKYPAKEWDTLGIWQARNSRDAQVFKVRAQGPARYIKIEFISHYGNEYYCPLSLLRVYGLSQMEKYKVEEQLEREKQVESWQLERQQSEKNYHYGEAITTGTTPQKHATSSDIESQTLTFVTDTMTAAVVHQSSKSDSIHPQSIATPASSTTITNSYSSEARSTINTSSLCTGSLCLSKHDANPAEDLAAHEQDVIPSSSYFSSSSLSSLSSSFSTSTTVTLSPTNTLSFTASESVTDTFVSTDPPTHSPSTSVETVPILPQSQPFDEEIFHNLQAALNIPFTSNSEESIYKTIMKRLSLLEINATLSQRYIEEQTHSFYKALVGLGGKITPLEAEMTRKYESTLTELHFHREQTRREILELSAKLDILAREITIEKRFTYVLMALLFIVVILTTILLPRLLFNHSAGISSFHRFASPFIQSSPLGQDLLSTIPEVGKLGLDSAKGFLTIPSVERAAPEKIGSDDQMVPTINFALDGHPLDIEVPQSQPSPPTYEYPIKGFPILTPSPRRTPDTPTSAPDLFTSQQDLIPSSSHSVHPFELRMQEMDNELASGLGVTMTSRSENEVDLQSFENKNVRNEEFNDERMLNGAPSWDNTFRSLEGERAQPIDGGLMISRKNEGEVDANLQDPKNINEGSNDDVERMLNGAPSSDDTFRSLESRGMHSVEDAASKGENMRMDSIEEKELRAEIQRIFGAEEHETENR